MSREPEIGSAEQTAATRPAAQPLRVAVIGCGYWGPKLVRNFHASAHSEVVLVADTRSRALQDIGAQYPSLETTTDVRRIWADQSIDAVAVATPAATHFPLCAAALQAGKHVFVEKPLTTDADEARELVRLAREHDRVVMVDHTFLYTGAVQKIRELIEDGTVGEVLYFDSVRVNLGLLQSDVNVLWDLAPHDLSILDYLVNERPVAVSAVGMRHRAYSDSETVAYLTYFFPGDRIAHVHVNWLAPVKVRRVTLGGSRKMIVWDDNEADEKVRVYDKGVDLEVANESELYQRRVQYRSGDMWVPRLDRREALQRECDEFVACVREGRKPHNDAESGLRVVQLLEAASRSLSAGGTRVAIESEDLVPCA